MPSYVPVDNDPFSDAQPSSGVVTVPAQGDRPTRVIMDMGAQSKLVPVDHDPFAESTISDVVKSGASGVARGVASLAGAPSDVSELGARGLDWLTQQVGKKLGIDIEPRQDQQPRFGSKDIQDVITSVVGDLHEPQTKAGEYARTIGEFVPGSLIGPGGLAAKAAQTIIPAVASETAGQATKGKGYEGAARFVGALAGGGLTALASRPGTATRALSNQMPEGVTAQMVDRAEGLMQQAKSQGIDLAWPEALSQVAGRPVLTNTMRHLEGAPQTEARMSGFFGNRPQQVENATRNQLDTVAPVNPAPSSVGPAVSNTAKSALTDVRGLINKASEPFYQSAEGVMLSPQEMAHVNRIPGFQQARDAVRNNPQLNSYVEHLPDNSVGFLNEVKKLFDQQGTNAASKFNPQANQQVSAVNSKAAEALKQIGIVKSPEYDVALQVQQQGRDKYLQPLLDGPLGKLAKKDSTTQDAINTLFPKNPLPNSELEIETAVSALSKRNPGAASDLVRAHIEKTFNEYAKDLQSGANQAGGAKFRVQLIGNPQQRLNLRSAVEALPNGADRWTGFTKLLDTLEATGTRQNVGSRTAYNAELLKEQSKSGLVGETSKAVANPVNGVKFLADKYERYKLGRNLNELANVLTDPRSGDLLRSIAKEPPSSSKALAVGARLLAAYGSARRTPVEKPNK